MTLCGGHVNLRLFGEKPSDLPEKYNQHDSMEMTHTSPTFLYDHYYYYVINLVIVGLSTKSFLAFSEDLTPGFL